MKSDKVNEEYSAGCIVFRKTKRDIEIAFLLDPFDKWTFAKGHIEKGESIPEAAVRETKEEMGIKKLRLISPLGKINWWFRKNRNTGYAQKDEMVHKFSYYYLAQAPDNTRLYAQKDELIKDVKWVPLSKALKFSDYKDILPVLKKAIDILNKKA